MLPTDNKYGDWPACGEIDIMEHVGMDAGKVHGTIHTEMCNHKKGTQVGEILHVLPHEWHTYGVAWSHDRLNFFFDGRRYLTVSKVRPCRVMHVSALQNVTDAFETARNSVTDLEACPAGTVGKRASLAIQQAILLDNVSGLAFSWMYFWQIHSKPGQACCSSCMQEPRGRRGLGRPAGGLMCISYRLTLRRAPGHRQRGF